MPLFDTLHLAQRLSDDEVKALNGHALGSEHFAIVVANSTAAYREDGTPLLVYLKDALSRPMCQLVFDTFKDVHGLTNRGSAAGFWSRHTVPEGAVIVGHGAQIRKLRSDGSWSVRQYSRKADSRQFGYKWPTPDRPWCRRTSFNINRPELFEWARPFYLVTDRLFREAAPEQWQRQDAFIRRVSPDFTIRDTVWTTGAINRNFRTHGHFDGRDVGFVALAVMEAGHYDHGELIFPKWGVAVDCRTGGLLLADSAEFHGNNHIDGEWGRFIRLSVVLYTARAIEKCGTAEEEQRRSKSTRAPRKNDS